MRQRYLLSLVFMLAACSSLQGRPSGPVDVASLPPLGGEERALIAAGDGAAQTGSFDLAERNYRDAASRSIGHVDAHLALARFYINSQKYAKAEPVLKQAAEWQPANAEVNYLLGKTYLQQAKANDALATFMHGLQATPDDANLLSGAAVAYDSMGEHKKAQALHRQSINAASGTLRTSFMSNLAMSYLLDNQPSQTVTLLEPEAKKPGMPRVLRHNLALAYGLLGRDAEARTLLQGDVTEEGRKQSVTQLKAYIAKEEKQPVRPAIHAAP